MSLFVQLLLLLLLGVNGNLSPSWLEAWKRPCAGVSSRDKAKETKCLNLQLL